MLPAIRSSRFDLPLTYEAGEEPLRVGDVVRVPLGSHEVFAFVLEAPRDSQASAPLRRIRAREDVPPAFDAIGLQVARFIAERYLCTLGEALSCVVLASSLPRVVDRFVVDAEKVVEPRAAVPLRLANLLERDLREGFSLASLLVHPEARRAGDRRAILHAISTLARAGAVRRMRVFERPRVREYRILAYEPGEGSVRGRKAEELVREVRERGTLTRADARLAGFSDAVIRRALSAGAIVERAITPWTKNGRASVAPMPAPSAEQAAAIAAVERALDAHRFSELLLHGVTGSGKTYVYIRALQRVVSSGGRAIVLVPEISLTPQTARRFSEAFERVAVLHSALSERERFDAWQACARGDIDVVVGARSALFAPLREVRAIVVDEAHESSYKQEQAPRYHAVTVARERMRLEDGLLLLGSATPPLESYDAARSGRIQAVRLTARPTGAPMPAVRIVDLRREFEAGNRRAFGSELAQAIGERLDRREKIVLLINRRGTSAFVLCRVCGNVPQCPRCSVSLTAHRGENLLRCHYCDFRQRYPRQCAACASETIRELGLGTQGVVEEVQRLYPQARVIRMDADATTRIGDHARLLDDFTSRGDVLVGTQMVAKGLDFPDVTLAGVVCADLGLHVADFRAAERTFDLIAQVCGRSGRAVWGEAIVQTYSPEDPAIVAAAQHDYDGFAQRELEERYACGYPPARRLVYLGVAGRDRERTHATAQVYAGALASHVGCEVFGPAPYPIAKLNDDWRFRIALRGANGRRLRAAIRESVLPTARAARETRLAINVDP